MTEQIIIFDTTLRDGEQSPGASMTMEQKQRVALQLEKLGVDVIEAGFPISSPGDFESVARVAAIVNDCSVAGLARAAKKDIEAAADALSGAKRPRIHTFIATSPIHLKEKLHLSPDEALDRAVEAVKLARNFTDDVEFSAEDACRSEIEFLCQISEAVIKAGAKTVNIPDTVGYTLPDQYGDLVSYLIDNIPNSDQAIFSCHCHNDLGLAVANSLSWVQHGGRQVECTINGIGERAGNASLEEIVMALKTRQDIFELDTAINTRELLASSKLVSEVTGFPVQPNKAIVGDNAFAHEAGIHQDGILKSRETYEIMRAEDIGWDENRLVLGKHSGRNAFQDRLQRLGVQLDSADALNDAFAAFKILADEKHTIEDNDLLALVKKMGLK